MTQEMDGQLASLLRSVEERYAQREAALDAYIEELEGRLSQALGALSEQVEEQGKLCAALSEQLASHSADLQQRLAGFERRLGKRR